MLMDTGWKHYEKNHLDSAIHYFNLSLERFPDELDALKFRGMAYAKKGDYRRAITDLSEALRQHVDSIETLSFRTRCYFYTGRMELAVTDATTIINLDAPDYK